MKILKLEVEGYRSLKSQTWCPGDLNVLIGPNASGKSNLLRVLEMLGAAARGGLGRYVQQEGGMEPIVWDGSADRIRFSAKVTPLPPWSDPVTDALTYKLDLGRLGTSSSYRIDHEILGNFHKVELREMPGPYILLERRPGHPVVFSVKSQQFDVIPMTTTTTTTPYPTGRPVEAPQESLPEEETLLSFARGPFALNRIVAQFQEELAAWQIHQDFQTHRTAQIRTAQVTRSETQVDSDGQNLIAVLHSLYTGNRDFENEVNTAMRSAFGEDFDKLVFPPAADQRIQMRIYWRSRRRADSAADLSDGTLRFLFLLAVLANPSPPPLIAIDEPETGLHPSMFPIVAEYARDAASRAQVILTTHSPEFLDALGDDVPTTTVVERQEGQTILRVLSGDELSYWLKQYTLGELFRSKELEAMK
jgi:predicted ATPase